MGANPIKINDLQIFGAVLVIFDAKRLCGSPILTAIRKIGTPIWGATGAYIEIHTEGLFL